VQAKAKRLSPVAHAFLGFIRNERVQISVLAERFAGQPRAPASAAPDSR
jgi:LysR family transcriptional regulator, putative pyruvate carboxylase regulator